MQKKERTFRVEAKNFDGGFDLLGIGFGMEMAKEIAEESDDYFVRIVECNKERSVVWSNW